MRYEQIGERWTLQIMDNGAVAFIDRQTGTRWGGNVPGWVTMRSSDGNEQRTALAAPTSVNRVECGAKVAYAANGFAFTAVFCFTDAGITLTIEETACEGTLVSLEYPAHMLRIDAGVRDGYTVIPHKQGTIIPARLDDGFMRFRHNTWRNITDIDQTLQFDSASLNMTWFGARLGASSVMAYIPEAADCSLHVVGNAVMDAEGNKVDSHQGDLPGERYSSLSPVWVASHGRLGYPRVLRLSLAEDGYVGMCKQYRALVKESGRYVSLREKIAQNPIVEGMVGAPDLKIYVYTNRRDEPRLCSWSEPILDGYERVHTTFDQVGEMVDEMKEMGIERALVLLGGWNRAGYDREHIDMWPPAEKAGGIEGLKRASRRAVDAGYVFSLHDNYQDVYPDSPSYDESYVMKHPDGSVHLGGIWDGGLCRLVCSSQAEKLAEPVIKAVKENSAVNSYYLDTTTSAPMYECYDTEHPITRKEDREHKYSLLEMLTRQGFVIGAEAGVDWAVPLCTFFEGMPGSAIGQNLGVESTGFGLMVPLFNLVYHDAVVCYWQHGQPFGREDHVNHVLHDLLSAQPSSWSFIYDQWEDLKPLIGQCYELLGRLHRKLAHCEMVSHEFLSSTFEVHRTTFDDGTEIIVNFGICSFEHCGTKIPPKGFLLREAGEPARVGGLSRDIYYQD